jgi:hypothetical protein
VALVVSVVSEHQGLVTYYLMALQEKKALFSQQHRQPVGTVANQSGVVVVLDVRHKEQEQLVATMVAEEAVLASCQVALL